jgi:hypothetical protein
MINRVIEDIKGNDRNAVGELHRQLRIHMDPNPDVGVFTQLYNKFSVQTSDRDDINQDIILLVWDKIVRGKCDDMRNWGEMRSYSSNICYKKCQALVKSRNKEKEWPDEGVKVVVGGVTIKVDEEINIETGLTPDLEVVLEELFKLFDPKCRHIWKIIMRFPEKKDKDKVISLLKSDKNLRKYKIPTGRNFVNVKSRCKSSMIKRAKKHPSFSTWKKEYEEFFHDNGDN